RTTRSRRWRSRPRRCSPRCRVTPPTTRGSSTSSGSAWPADLRPRPQGVSMSMSDSPEPAADVIDADRLQAEVEETRPPHAGPVSQVAAALTALAVGVAGAIGSYALGLGRLTQPGPGLWPFVISVVIVVLSAVLVVTGRKLEDTERFSKASLLTAVGLVT